MQFPRKYSVFKMKPRVLYLHYHDAPYRNPALTVLKDSDAFLKFQVATMFPKDTGHAYWGLDYDNSEDVLLGKTSNKGGRKWHPKISQLLKENTYDAFVINGFYHYTSLYLLYYACARRIPAVFISDNVTSSDWGCLKRTYERVKIRILKWISRSFWVPGRAGAAYLEEYGGVRPEAIFPGAYVMEMPEIQKVCSRARSQRSELRAKYGFGPRDRVLLMAANFIENRQHTLLVEAFVRSAKKHKNLRLLLLGEGPYLEQVKQIARTENMESKIVFPGGVPFDQLPEVYSMSDIYIHAGSEPYSTAVMYAAYLGMPLLVSRAVGAVEDVLHDEQNGFVFESGTVEALVNVLEKTALLSDDELSKMGARSLEIAKFYEPTWAAMNLTASIEFAINNS